MSRPAKQGKALLLGVVDHRAPLAVTRSLGRAGVEVHFAWHESDNLALTSRYAGPTHAVPSYRENDDAPLDALEALLQRERFDLVIPVNDTSAAALQHNRARLQSAGSLYTIPDSCFEVFMDKVRTAELARQVGVNVPAERVVTQADDAPQLIDELIDELGLPIVLKPDSSYNPANPSARRMVSKAFTRDELAEALPPLLAEGAVAVQRNFLGVGVGVELLLHEGRPLLEFQHERVNEPLHGGGSSYRKSVAVDPELRQASLALLSPLQYTGVAMVEFKVNHQTGEWVLIEVNPRFWGSLPLAVGCSVDFPAALYRLLVNGQEPPPARYRPHVHSRAWRENLQWQIANLRADASDPTLAAQPLTTVVGQTAKNLLLLRERSDAFAFDDPKPAFAELSAVASYYVGAVSKRLGRIVRTFGPVRRSMRRSALETLKPARRVVFVCLGNICRSPFAEIFARQQGVFDEVRSAGFIEREGRTSPPQAIEIADSRSVDLTPHRSRLLRREDVDWADAVVIFDEKNRRRIAQSFPDALSKTCYWGALDDQADAVIPDPYAQGPEAFVECYRRIEQAAARLAQARNDSP